MVSTFLIYAVPTVCIIYGIRKYRESKWGKCKNKIRLDGKIVLITGANSGIGFETAKELAQRGATVILACRNRQSALQAINSIKKEVPNSIEANFDTVELDLASLKSIKACANEIIAKYETIDILINNAGVSYPNNKKILTSDGFEIHFGVNYLGHFFLTKLLLDIIKKSSYARIINISSLLHQKGELNLDDLNYDKRILKNPYADSKLAMMYFGRELSIQTTGTNVKVYSLCPGWVLTNLFRHNLRNIFRLILALPIAILFMRSRKQGSQTGIYCCTDPSLSNETGYFYRECTRFKSSHAFDNNVARKLWEISEDMIKEKMVIDN